MRSFRFSPEYFARTRQNPGHVAAVMGGKGTVFSRLLSRASAFYARMVSGLGEVDGPRRRSYSARQRLAGLLVARPGTRLHVAEAAAGKSFYPQDMRAVVRRTGLCNASAAGFESLAPPLFFA